jgi:N-acylglucosamine 2-epimerase
MSKKQTVPGIKVPNRKAGSSEITSDSLPTLKKKKSLTISGMSLRELGKDYRKRIFKEYLPFWEKGGYDHKYGGFMCELKDDGSVVSDEKYIWYQGRGIWVYAYLYNHFGRKGRFLDIALKSRDFLVKNMYIGEGKWRDSVDRQGNPVESTVAQGSGKDIYGALFSAAGLVELYKATGNEDDLRLAKESIWASVRTYESPDYEGVTVPGINLKGLRTQGHSFVLVWLLTNLLSFHKDLKLEKLQKEHVGHMVNHFWNPEYGIVNEDLFHDYTRIPGHESIMFPGHSLEALWMVMDEAVRIRDRKLFDTMKDRIRRLIEMNWDYIFGGMATEEYRVFSSDGKCAGPSFDLKVMWAHTELLLSSLMIYEHTGETWSKEWYERGRAYSLRTMANTGNGVWRQAVDRFGQDKKRPGISIYRKDNFHQVRY